MFLRLIYLGLNLLALKTLGIDIWDEIIDKTEIYLLELLESGEIKLMLARFHHFVDWLSKEENVDMIGIEL